MQIATRLWLKLILAAVLTSALAACGQDRSIAENTPDSSSIAAAKTSTPKQLQDQEAIVYAQLALSTYPHLPLTIAQLSTTADNQSIHSNQALNATTGLKVLSLEQNDNSYLESCEDGGFINIEREPQRVQSSVDSQIIETTTHFQFMDCMTDTRSGTQQQRGDFTLNTSRELSDQQQTIGEDRLATFNKYSHSQTTLDAHQSHGLDGEFGLSVVTNNNTFETTTLLAASGTISSTSGESNSHILFDRFGVVFENSPNQQLLYLYGHIKATFEGQKLSYVLSTLEPMGVVDETIQGRFLIEAGASKIVISRVNTDELMIELDKDGDGSIDYATTLAANDIHWPIPPSL